jgi:FtsH-binding integral membrane protein
MDFLKSVTGKVVSGLVVLAVVAAGISWWQMEPQTREMLVSGAGRIVAWTFAVLLLPWATFFVISRVNKLDSNLAGGVLVFTYTLLEVVVLAWLFKWRIPGATAWVFLIAAALLAGVYNLFACDWIAEKVE